MDDQWTRRVWPPAGQDDLAPATQDLPPSAGWYGTPTPPPPPLRRRLPRWALRLIVGFLALAAAGGVISAAVVAILSRADSTPPPSVTDNLAGVAFALPAGWSQGMVAPVTGFTSVAAHGDLATVMARPAGRVDPADLRGELLQLSELYSRLLLHGDKVDVVDDRTVTVNGRQGYTRALRAEYRDVVNQPAFLRVTLLISPDGKSTVLLGLAHPDEPRSRAEIDAIMSAIR